MSSTVHPSSALVLLSGGQDSATCLAIACQMYSHVHTVCFDYGQRHRVEIEQARQLSSIANVSFEVVEIPVVSQITKNALTDTQIEITHDSGELPSTFVPGRNALFLNLASIIAYHHNIHDIYMGVCQTDYSGYPDCRDDFIQSMQTSLSLAMSYPFRIHTPLMYLTKAETVQKMAELNGLDWYAHTHTCYEGARPPCGACPACLLRSQGFEAAGVQDPLMVNEQPWTPESPERSERVWR